MSSIAGVFRRDGGPVERAELADMLAAMPGRDCTGGLWHEGAVGLAQHLLQVTPESVHDAPSRIYRGDGLALVADARIDNRDEIIQALRMTRGPANDAPDTDLILAAYLRWGEDCPRKLLGDFVFVIWDMRSQSVFCARDHCGTRPLYYFCSDRLFAFASRIAPMLRLRGVPHRLNEAQLARYLVSDHDDKESTLYAGIKRLTPAHTMTVGRGDVRMRRYWSLDPKDHLRLRSDRDYADAFRAVFSEAVRCRMRAVGPIGSTLSGGLDSSSIATVAHNILQQEGASRLHTFSAVYDDAPASDETPYINAVLRGRDMLPHYIHPERRGPLTRWDEGVQAEDEPLWNPQAMLHWAIYESARENGVHVVLDGLGGDDVVSHGYGYLTQLLARGRWPTLWREAVALRNRAGIPLKYSLWFWGAEAFLPDVAIQTLLRATRRSRPSVGAHSAPIRPGFAERAGVAIQGSPALRDLIRTRLSCRWQHWFTLSAGLPVFGLELTARTASAFAVEPRFPFFDRRVMEFCLALPPEQKLCHGWTRRIVRDALSGLLPDEIRWRADKSDLSPSFTYALLTHDRDALERVCTRDVVDLSDFIDVDSVRQTYRRYLLAHGSNDGFILWKVAELSRWLHAAEFVSSGDRSRNTQTGNPKNSLQTAGT